MSTKKMSPHAVCAAEIRQVLKQRYPDVTFRVTSRCFSMGNSVDIKWINGPRHDEVATLTRKYQYGHFDGMDDCYHYSNCHEDIPQAKYVQCTREIDDETYMRAFEICKAKYADFKDVQTPLDFLAGGYCCAQEFLWRYLSKMDLSQGITEEMFCSLDRH